MITFCRHGEARRRAVARNPEVTLPVVDVYPADTMGCGSYRAIWPVEELCRQGAEVRLIYPGQGKGLATYIDPKGNMSEVVRPDCDVIVLQRPLDRRHVEVIPLLQRKHVAVVVEIDDDFHAVHRGNVNHDATHASRNRKNNREHLAECCRLADLVTVSSPALAARYGSHGRVRVIRNRVRRRNLSIDHAVNEVPVVGWGGALEVHPTDLDVTGRGIARAVGKAAAEFRVIGPGTGVRRKLDLWADPDVTGYVPIDDYPEALAGVDVGIAPLDLIPFNEAKSALKPLEYASVGTAAVGSPVGEYLRVAKDGVCRIASTPNEWERHVRQLVSNPELRADEVGRAREAVAARHVLEDHVGEWMDAWAAAVRTTKGVTSGR